MKSKYKFLQATCALIAVLLSLPTIGQESGKISTEGDYYKIINIPIPADLALEVGGLAALPNGKLAVSTRRGEVWMVENPYMENFSEPFFKKYASGLADILGLAYKDGSLYFAQRGELTKMSDENKDGKADKFETIFSWPLSGHYHEFSYGPKILPNGDFIVTLNVAFDPILWWQAESYVKWRGWMLRITPDGKMTPLAAGLRSPAGFGVLKNGDIFYSENQGDWVGTGGITHIEKGDFVGNPASLRWADQPDSPVKLKIKDIPDSGKPMFEVAKGIPGLKTQAVMIPHTILGLSTSEILENAGNNKFAPFFEGQLFVGDQGQSKITRVFLEKVNGQYQGAAFPFREGFNSGVLRIEWGTDGSMFVGSTNRGWGSTGQEPYGLQRMIWTGKTPFEIKSMSAKPDGFELEFTKPVDKKSASNIASYQVSNFTYKYHAEYGSPVTNLGTCPVRAAVVAEDGLKVRLVLDSLREGYVHELKAADIRSTDGFSLLHSDGYYTLKSIPSGEKLNVASSSASHSMHMSHGAHGADTKPAKTALAKEANKPAPSVKHLNKMPSTWKGVDKTITVNTKPGLKFDPSEIVVKAGSKIKLTFNNNDDMLHNFVIVQPGQAIVVGEMTMKMGLQASKFDYVPKTDKVLYHTKTLQPMSSETIYFTAPTKPGNYTYVCTFPGHYYVMQGTLKVMP
ncbi:MAG TPA: plastocyanin/azurin family copper-binding protein [Cytophagaceae bacterium]|jgi:azurin/glucose/arabinose dehydrogenase